MKKTMILLLGLLMASAMPGSGLKAQNTLVGLRVQTLDRAAVVSAKVYSAHSMDEFFFIETALVAPGFAATSIDIATLTPSMELAKDRMSDGSWRLYQNVDMAAYDTAFVVIKDANNVHYVYGTGDGTQRGNGVFKACELLTALAADSVVNTSHIVFGSSIVTVCESGGFQYTTLTKAVDSVSAGATIRVLRSFTANAADGTAVVSKPVTVDLNGYAITGSILLENDADTVVVKNGTVTNVTGSTSAVGAVRLDGLTVTSLWPNQNRVYVDSCIVSNVFGATTSNLFIRSGNFNSETVKQYLVPRRALIATPTGSPYPLPYFVVEGYEVVFHNYNGRIGQPGYADSVAVINTPDNRIVPAPSRPTYVGADTVFGHYWKDAAFTTPWLFDQDVLTGPDTLYAKWQPFDAATQIRVSVAHRCQNVTRDGYVTVDSLNYILAKDPAASHSFPAFPYVGFRISTGGTLASCGMDGHVDIIYNRDTMIVTWDANGGVFEDAAFGTEQVLAYDSVVSEMPVVRKTGHDYRGWKYAESYAVGSIVAGEPVTVPLTIPAPVNNGDTIKLVADYERNTYDVRWNNVRDTVRIDYNGEDRSGELTAEFKDDDNVWQTLTLNYSPSAPRKVGTYNVTATYSDTNYLLVNNTKVLVIEKVKATAGNVAADTIKKYDTYRHVEWFDTVASLVDPAPFGNDDVWVYVDSVLFHDASVGRGKTVTAYFGGLRGSDSDNYELRSSFISFCSEGVIAPAYAANDAEMEADSIEGVYVGVNGFCAGDESGVSYYLASDNGLAPNEYKLVFDSAAKAQGFADVSWTSLEGYDMASKSGSLAITVPENAERGVYQAKVSFRNSDYTEFESYEDEFASPARSITFGVKLNKQYTRPLFEDVIAIVDTTNAIDLSTIQWYRNGEAIAGATHPYYQEVGGFVDGATYYASFRFTGENETVYTCPQDSLGTDNYVQEGEAAETTVAAYPNPTVDYVTVKVENATQFSHSVRVMNVMGATVYEGSFNGDSTRLDFSQFANGSYTVSVDGIVVRVIKK